MKILSIKSLNINSLKGKTEINFADLTKDSALFAITGPTGSGKSTILDIISCALYGRTARLKNPNDLMSRHCGEAYCEVEFEIRGKIYRSSWTQKRARKKHDGKFQGAKMELSFGDKILTTGSREVPKYIEELSGLDFGRFTQSMLLAQGGFDAFLKADEKERSALLEKITGTQIYADISIAIFEKHRTLAQDMESDAKIAESIELLDEELVKEKKLILSQNISAKKQTDEELKELLLSLSWLQRLVELQEESKKSETAFIDAKKIKEQNKESFEKLTLANRALNVSSAFTSHSQLQKSVESDKKSFLNITSELDLLAQDIKKKETEYTSVKKEFQEQSSAFEVQNEKLKLAREIQTQEKQTQESVVKLEVSCESKKESLQEIKKSLNAVVKSYNTLQTQVESKKSYLKNSAKDEKLLSTLGLIKSDIKQYKEELSSFTLSQSKLENVNAVLKDEETKYTLIKESLSKLSEVFEAKESQYKEYEDKGIDSFKIEEEIAKSLEDTQTLLRTLESHTAFSKKRESELKELESSETLEKSLLQTQRASQEHIDEIKKHIVTLRDKKEKEQLLKKYEDDRETLVEGEACFLCGSLEHPYAEELSEVQVDETKKMIANRLQELEGKEQELKELESHISVTQTKKESSKLELQKLHKEIENLESLFKRNSFELRSDSEGSLKERQEELTKHRDELKRNRIKKDELLKAKESAGRELQTQEKLYNELNVTLQKYKLEKEQITLTLNASKSKSESLLKSLKEGYKAFDIELDTELLETQYQELKRRKELYVETLDVLKSLERELSECSISKKESETKLTLISVEIETLSNDVKESKSKMDELVSKRIEILNVADLDAHEKMITLAYKTAQEREGAVKNHLSELMVKNSERLAYKKELDLKIVEEEKRLKLLVSELEKLYKENGFKNANELENAVLSSVKREELTTLCKAIEDKYTQTQTIKVQIAKKLQEHEKESLTTKPMQELETLQALLTQKSDALQESLGSVRKELELNQENREKHQEKIESLQKKKEAFKVWVKLNELVGSADGTKFKKFAQGITLDQLINLANQHLNILSSRYTLSRSQEKLLELEVIDAYQGNAVRPVSTLSGGESFIVSLALALGLSELASQKIAIDSLFLDEGFGTLDEESLETALNALNLLQSGGKMVGVISHVEALKERIPLQIRVVPNGDGSSFVESSSV